MEQLNLGILPQVVYRPEHFLLHRGVKNQYDETIALLSRSGYSAVFLSGIRRSGKTHFAIKVACDMGVRGYFPRMIDGASFRAFLAGEGASAQFRPDEVVIVDDASGYFSEVQPGGSGPFVQLVERLRSARAHLMMTSTLSAQDFPCDAHVQSRLGEASKLRLEDPDEESVPELLSRMARQHGIQLTDRKVEFLERRMRRSVASIEEYMEKVVHLSSVLGKKVSLSLLGDAL